MASIFQMKTSRIKKKGIINNISLFGLYFLNDNISDKKNFKFFLFFSRYFNLNSVVHSKICIKHADDFFCGKKASHTFSIHDFSIIILKTAFLIFQKIL